MYEYKVIKTYIVDAESEMNALAKEGWRVIEISPNIAKGYGLVITFEREVKE